MYPCQYALLSRDRKSEPCSREQWLAHFNSGQYNPTLVREQVREWQLELSFRGTWTGEGTPKFFSVSVDGRNHCDDRQEFATFEEARNALGHAHEECWRRSEKDPGQTGEGAI
jgi:hypothetical protein